MFNIDTEAVKRVSGDIREDASKLRIYAAEVRLIAASPVLWSKSYYGTRDALRTQAGNVFNVAGYTQNLSGKLDETCLHYELTERKLLGKSLADVIKNLWGQKFTIPSQSNLAEILKLFEGKSWRLPGAVSINAISGAISAEGSLFGILYSGAASGSALRFDANGEVYADWDPLNKNVRIGAKGGFDGALLEGEASGEFGLAQGEIKGKVGHVSGKGEIGASIWDKDGNLNPSIQAKIQGEASLLEGEASGRIGTDKLNVNAQAEGKVLTAQGEASARAGIMDDGSIGVEAKVGGDAYLAKGSVSGGLNIFGIKINATATGGVGGVEFNAGGKVTTNGVSGEIGLGFIAGGNVKVDVDWSEFTLVEDVGKAVAKAGENLYNAGKQAVSTVGEWAAGGWKAVTNFFGRKK